MGRGRGCLNCRCGHEGDRNGDKHREEFRKEGQAREKGREKEEERERGKKKETGRRIFTALCEDILGLANVLNRLELNM